MTNDMRDNPYAPPQADLDVTIRDTPRLAGGFDIGQSLSDGWRNTWSNFGVLLGGGVLWALLTILAAVTVIGYFIVVPVLGWGLAKLALNVHDGGASVGDIFGGFSDYLRNLGRTLLYVVVLVLLSLVGQIGVFVGQAMDSTVITAIGYLMYFAFSFAVLIRLYFAFFILVDQDVSTVDAFKASWEATQGKTASVVLLGLLSFVVGMAGLLAFGIGIIVSMMVSGLMWVSAYRQMYPLRGFGR